MYAYAVFVCATLICFRLPMSRWVVMTTALAREVRSDVYGPTVHVNKGFSLRKNLTPSHQTQHVSLRLLPCRPNVSMLRRTKAQDETKLHFYGV